MNLRYLNPKIDHAFKQQVAKIMAVSVEYIAQLIDEASQASPS